jgi:hypothetical protein
VALLTPQHGMNHDLGRGRTARLRRAGTLTLAMAAAVLLAYAGRQLVALVVVELLLRLARLAG